MSFKREGDDWCLLNNLKKRRVSELLSLHIPEDEAILMRNGRYSCSICPYRPVFDTINVLALHRKGKKHLRALSNRLSKEEEIRPVDTQAENTVSTIYKNCTKQILTAKKTRHDRKRTLVIENKDEQSSVENKSHSNQTGETKTVDNYLRKIEKKRNFVDLVEKRRQYANINLPSHVYPITSITCEKTKINTPKNSQEKAADLDNTDKKEEMERYLKLREKGWRKNQNGEWEREEDVEFDSDDDQPQIQ